MIAKAALASLLEEPLTVVDVGCRWGVNPMWTDMGDRCLLIGFDPDAEECARLESLAGPHAAVRFVPVALGPAPGLATLYMTKNPGGYSVYPSSADAVEHHPGLDGGRVEQTMVISVTSLDDWCRSQDVPPRIDVIKLDTQGSELGILQGAEEVLAGVRAVEVEVQFNELYEDVPLFGDVDRYLREQGFMLWRLRNMAHYAQHGVPTDWRTRDAQYFDEVGAIIAAGSGQLYWADAYYVKVDVARPTAALGWRQLLRDACVSSVLGFHDLVALAVQRAREDAPPAVAAQLDNMLAAASDRSRLPHLFSLGQAHVQGWGWSEPQAHASGGLRWTGPARDASVDIPVVVRAGTRIEVLVVAAMSQAILEQLVVELDHVPVPLSSSPHEHGTLFCGVVPDGYQPTRGFTRMVFRTIETVPWNQIQTDSPDDSEFGAAVSWVRFSALDDR